MNEHMVTMDPPAHTRERALLDAAHHLQAPEGERGVHDPARRPAARRVRRRWQLRVHRQLFASRLPCSWSPIFSACPSPTIERFREGFGLSHSPGEVGSETFAEGELNALIWLDDWFAHYIEERRRQPRNDVLTDLALATYPDGGMPDMTAVVRTATFLFAAGQETTARLLAVALKYLAEQPGATGPAARRTRRRSPTSSKRHCASRAR